MREQIQKLRDEYQEIIDKNKVGNYLPLQCELAEEIVQDLDAILAGAEAQPCSYCNGSGIQRMPHFETDEQITRFPCPMCQKAEPEGVEVECVASHWKQPAGEGRMLSIVMDNGSGLWFTDADSEYHKLCGKDADGKTFIVGIREKKA